MRRPTLASRRGSLAAGTVLLALLMAGGGDAWAADEPLRGSAAVGIDATMTAGAAAATAGKVGKRIRYRTLGRLGVTARNARLTGKVVQVRLSNKRKVEIRLAVIRNRQRKLQAWNAVLLRPGSRTLKRRLNATPRGSKLNLRVTARIGKLRARGIISLTIIRPTPPPPPPPPGAGNSAPTAIGLSNSSVAENQPAGTTVGTLSGTDANAGDTLSFALVGGTGGDDNAAFTIDGTALKAGAAFDAEVKSSYSVRVRVADGRGGTFERALAITVTNVDEAPSTTATGTLAYTENDPATAIAPALTVADVDSTSLTGATVQLTGNYNNGQDVLALPAQPGITDSFDAASGTLTLSGTAAVAAYETALRAVTYRNSSDNPDTGNRTVTLKARDAAGFGAAGTRTITVAAVNDAPVITATAGALGYTENAAATAIDPGLLLADPDSQITGATVQITANHVQAQDDLGFTNQPGITGSYDDATGTLTLTGSASVADYRTALRSITYVNTSATPSTTQRTVSFSVTDGALASNVATRNITITAANDAPVVTTSGGTTAYTENGSAVVVDATVTPSDVDDTSLESAQVRISAGFDTGDLLAFITQNGITGSYTAGTGVLTLTGTASVANYLIALRSVGFSSTSDNPALSKTVEFKVNDGDVDSNLATKAIAVTRANDAPLLDTTNAALAYAEGAGPVAADSGLTVTDPDSAQIQGATVQITSNFVSAQDELAFATQLGISGSYDDATGTLTLTGTTTIANYQAALRAVTYENSSDDPSPPTRTLTFVATDAEGAASAPATRDITLGAANDSATVTTTGAAQSYTEGDAATAIDGGLTVSDPDDVNLTGATVQITGGLQSDDELLFTSAFGITDGGYVPATGVLTLTGTATLANYQLALRAVQYRHNGDNPSGPKTAAFRADDGDGLGPAGTRNIAITPVNDAPAVTTSGASATFNEGGGPALVDGGLTIADPDSAQLSGATAAISANFSTADDALAVTLQGAITGGYDAGTGVLTLSGAATLTQYRDVLRSVTYANSSDNPAPATRTISFQVTDSSAAPSNVATRGVTLAGANDAAVITTTGGDTTYTENAASVAVDGGVTVTDVDDTSLQSAQVRISSGLDSGDTLTFTPTGGAGGAGSAYNAGTGVLTLTGPGTVADFQTVLRSVGFSSTNDSPALSKAVEFKVNDGDADSNLATKAIAVTAVNDAPVADDDPFGDALGNTRFVVGTTSSGPRLTVAGDVLDGDSDVDTPAASLTAAAGTITSTQCAAPPTCVGNVTMESDGQFTYDPKPGYTGDDTFTYTVTDNDADAPANQTDTGIVTITVVGPVVWYVDGDSGPTGDGRSHSPANTLSALSAGGGLDSLDGSDDIIFVYGAASSYSGGLSLEAGQSLIGEPHSLDVDPAGSTPLRNDIVPAGGSNPVIVNGSGNGLTLSTGNTMQAMSLGNASGAALIGTGVGSATMNTTTAGTINNTTSGGRAVDISGGTLNMAFSSVSATGGTQGIRLDNTTGTFTGSGGTLSSATGTDVVISGNDAGDDVNFTYNGAISDDSGQLVSISDQTGGTKDFNGAIDDNPADGDGGGISVSSNNAATTTRFDGGLSLYTGSSNAIVASSAGTLAITDPGGVGAGLDNILFTTTGTPLTVTNTTIHDDDLTFRSIASNGAANGIVLNATSSANGRLVVAGNGGACTGFGTCSGGEIQNSTGAGIALTSVPGGASFTRVAVTSGGDDGIRATTVNDVDLADSVVTNNGNSHAGGAEERGLDYLNVTGTPQVLRTTVSGSDDSNANIRNTVAGSTTLSADQSTFSNSKFNAGLRLRGEGSSVVSANVTNSTFSLNADPGFSVQTDASNTAQQTVLFDNNTVSGGSSNAVSGRPQVSINTDSASVGRFTISNNRIKSAAGAEVIVNTLASQTAAGSLDAKVINNTINDAQPGSLDALADGGSAIWGWAHGDGAMRMEVTNNTVQNWGGRALELSDNDGNGSADYTVTGNTFNTPDLSVNNFEGMYVFAGGAVGDAANVCVDMKNNDFDAIGQNSTSDLAIDRFSNGTAQLRFAGHNGTTVPGLQTYLRSVNPLSGALTAETYSNGPTATAATACTLTSGTP